MGGTPVFIGCGAGFAGDRTDAAVPVVEALAASGGPAFLIYETLAERTLADTQSRRRAGGVGYLPRLTAFLRPVLARCVTARIPIIGNFGAADPPGAAAAVRGLAHELGVPGVRVAAITGDDLLARLGAEEIASWPMDPPLPEGAAIVSANVYLGAGPIAAALAEGAQVVAIGRCADPALALGPLLHARGWAEDDWNSLALGTVTGHLLECAAQVTGGYFADPGFKDVSDLATVGYPIAHVGEQEVTLTKPPGTGGRVSTASVKEQLLYEIHDPAAYLTPDVVLDLTGAEVAEVGPDRVRISGMRGHARPERLKATVCIDGGWLGEGGISYAGPNAVARARLAIEVLAARLALAAPGVPYRADVIGVVSLFNDAAGEGLKSAMAEAAPEDVRVRLALRHLDRTTVERAMAEVEALYTAGPAGGGGVRVSLTPCIASHSCFVARELVEPRISIAEAQP